MRRFLAVATLLALSVPTFAQSSEPEVTVTATRVSVLLENVGDDVDIITQEQIKEMGFTSITDVLKYVAGVHFYSNGGWGKQSNVFIQGLNGRYILVLVNGVPVNDPSTPNGKANFEWIDLNNVERIEVLKGSQSALYGSEAIGGVINIITKKPEKNSFSVRLEGGKYKTFKENVYGALKLKGGFLSLSAENFKTNGFSVTNKHVGSYYNGDNDPFHYTTGNISFGYFPSENVKFYGNFLVKGGYSDFDNGRGNYNRLFADLRAQIISSDKLSWEILLSNNREKRDYTFYSVYGSSKSLYNGITRFVSISPTYYLNESTFLKAGASYRYEKARVNSYPNVDNKSQFIRSLFLEGYTELHSISISAAGRIDNHSRFGSHGTYKVSLSYRFSPTKTLIKGQYGTGFKAPTLSELYGYYVFYYQGQTIKTIGNPDLNPEKSEGWDITLQQEIPLLKASISATYFKNRIWDRINKLTVGATTTYENSGKLRTEGLELKGEISPIDFLKLYGNYTHTNVVGKKDDKLRIPEDSFTLGFKLTYGRLTFNGWAEHYSSRKDFDFSTGKYVRLSSFTTYNCYVSYALNDRVNIYAKGVNLTDKDYELVYGYNTMGRALFIGTDFRF